VSVPVLTAVTDAVWEAQLVAALDREDHGVAVVRRCVDLPDLLAVAAAGTARAAIISADLRRLDQEALVRLEAAGVAVVALVAPGDEPSERRMRQLGLGQVLPGDAAPEQIVRAVLAAVAAGPPSGAGASYADPRAGWPDMPADVAGDLAELRDGGLSEPGSGRLIAVWGPTGAPGRTTIAVTLAGELAQLGVPTLLADADTYGGVVAQALGIVDESPGLAGAARLANAGSLDVPALAALARGVGPNLRVLTGISRADRWPELRPHALEVVWSMVRRLAAVTVVDCGFALEQDEEITYDTLAPRRNGATVATIEAADTVVAVAAADPVGLARFVRSLTTLRALLAGADPLVVVNRVRPGIVGSRPEAEIGMALERFAGVTEALFVPLDLIGCDAAIFQGRTLPEVAPSSPVRQPMQRLAARVAGIAAPSVARRGWGQFRSAAR
jgi:MinD-like ATPase involved in chromosome partitioning or flagellar assembly